MDLFRNEELIELLSRTDGLCVSIYMPAHRVGWEQQQDPVRLKNLLDQAEKQLADAGMRTPDARTLLENGRELLDDKDFWQHQSDGLAVFIDKDRTLTYRLPLDFEELVFAGEQFHTKPLLPLLSGDGQFYVLAISLKEIRLLEGTRYLVEAIDLEDVPTSMSEALWFEDIERHLQWHTETRSSGGAGDRPASYHGQGAVEDDVKNNILRYFNRVDRELVDLLQNGGRPLVLAGVDYLLPIYREANSYPHLIDEGVTGNPEELSAKELHQQAWEVVEPVFSAAGEEASARYQELAGMGSDEASDDLEEIVKAAVYGRVDTLFVALDLQRWGKFDSETNTVDTHEEYQHGDQDLLDLAATHTLNNSGTVYARPVEEIPGSSAATAIFRYGYEGQ